MPLSKKQNNQAKPSLIDRVNMAMAFLIEGHTLLAKSGLPNHQYNDISLKLNQAKLILTELNTIIKASKNKNHVSA